MTSRSLPVNHKIRDWKYLDGYEFRIQSNLKNPGCFLLVLTEGYLEKEISVRHFGWFNGSAFIRVSSRNKNVLEDDAKGFANFLFMKMHNLMVDEYKLAGKEMDTDFSSPEIENFLQDMIDEFVKLYPMLSVIEI